MSTIALVACNDEQVTVSDQTNIQNALDAVAQEDYGKAEGLLEKSTDATAQAYYAQILLLREGQQLIDAGNAQEATTKLSLAIDYQGGSKVIAAQAEELLATTQHSDEAVTQEEKEDSEEQKKTPVAVDKAPAQAEVIADVSGMTYVQLANKDGNVRAQADINSKVVHSGHLGDVFIYLQEKVNTADGRTWYKVEYGSGSVGYISRAVANLTNEMPSYVRLIENGTNIRSEPNINSTVIYTGSKNEVLYYSYDKTYTKDGRTWLHVYLGGETYGYVSQKVATMTTQVPKYIPTTVNNTYTEDFTQVVITAKDGNLRSEPDINSAVVHQATKGDTFSYTGYYEHTADGRTWYEVYVGNTYGYISKAVGKLQ